MGAINRKLNSQRGVSMVIALVFFLACLMIGGAILTAATANGIKAKDRTADQQDYLAVASAARLLKHELGGTAYTVTPTRHDDPIYGEVDGQTVQVGTDTYYTFETEITHAGILTDSTNAACDRGTGKVTFSFFGSSTYTITPSCSDEMALEADYSIGNTTGTATFVIRGKSHTQTVTFMASVSETSVTWTVGTISKGDTTAKEGGAS
ncbi:MAG: hypothetical protein LKJ86_09090 [Oscillibacter sp.]|jgi:hypothetical protein|nr:hypothetical protein [Oscillibacter sp.]